jgi:membrane-associated phospholipid phosphatase
MAKSASRTNSSGTNVGQMKSVAICFFVFLVVQSPLVSQNKYDLVQFRDETVDCILQPIRWEGNEWLKLGLIGAGTFLTMQADEPVRDAVMKDQNYYNSAPITLGKFWGGPYPTAVLAGAFGLHGLLMDDKSTRKIGFEIVQAALYSGGITTALKVAFGRARPYTNEGRAEYKPFTFWDDGYHSLPSGHTTWAFALSTVLSRNTESTALKVLAYTPAALTIVARIYQDEHWISDCLLGAVVGYAVATWVVDLHDQKESTVQVSSIYPLTIRININ